MASIFRHGVPMKQGVEAGIGDPGPVRRSPAGVTDPGYSCQQPCESAPLPIRLSGRIRMKRHVTALVCAATMATSVCAQRFELSLDSKAAADALTIAPTNPLSAPYRPTALDRAVRDIGRQIDEKRAADAPRSAIEMFWEAEFWSSPLMKLIPVGGGPQRYPEDPYLLPAFLTVLERQSDYQLKLSDE